MSGTWFQNSYNRLLVDMHITDHDESFMREFDPEVFVNTVKQSGIDACMFYACCHNGNCYYPSKVGHPHPGIEGRDVFGEVVSLLRKENIIPVAYYTSVYHNKAAEENPDWRMYFPDGTQKLRRYKFCCPNHADYREFVKTQLDEILEYDVEGIFVDMTFWPGICVCPSCRERYLKETGKEIPTKVDWNDSDWLQYQFSRERWMTEFSSFMSDHVKSRKDITYTCQFSPIAGDWSFGTVGELQDTCEYSSGDFHGGRVQQIMGVKMMQAYSQNTPYEFMTPLNESLFDHDSPKSESQLVCEASNTLANGGAFFFIHDLNADGTIEPSYYKTLGNVIERLKPYSDKVKSLRSRHVSDVGIYYEPCAKVDVAMNGMATKDACDTETNQEVRDNPYVDEVKGTCQLLARQHIAFEMVHKNSLAKAGLKTLILNNCRYMSDAEVEQVRQFVADGGTLIATKDSSLFDKEGGRREDFGLRDVFGVSHTGKETPSHHFFYDHETKRYLSNFNMESKASKPSFYVKAVEAETLASVAIPKFAPEDIDQWSSIHCNPPSDVTEYAAITVNAFGKGKCIYIYSDALGLMQSAHEAYWGRLLDAHLVGGIVVDTNAPSCVEITLQESTLGSNTHLVSFLNYQGDQPNLPVYDIRAKLALPKGIEPIEARNVKDESEVPFTYSNGEIELGVKELHYLEMIELKIK